MAKAVGQLWVGIGIKTGQFDQGMTKAETRMTTFGARVKKIGAGLLKITKIASGFGLAFAAATIVLVKRSMETIDVQAKLARQIGISTEALIGFQHAADQTGPGAELLNNALSKMSINLGLASAGMGPAIKGLEQLGLRVEDMVRLNAERQFLAIADAMSRMTSEQQRAAAAAQIFGLSGAKLVNTLSVGRKALEAYRRESVKLGMSFTTEQAGLVESANDAIDRLKKGMKSAFVQLAIELSPIFQAISEDILSALKPDVDKFGRPTGEVSGIAKALESGAEVVALGTQITQVYWGYAQQGLGVFFTLFSKELGEGYKRIGEENVASAKKGFIGQTTSERTAIIRQTSAAALIIKEKDAASVKAADLKAEIEKAAMDRLTAFNAADDARRKKIIDATQTQFAGLLAVSEKSKDRIQKMFGRPGEDQVAGAIPFAAQALIKGTQAQRSADIAARLGATSPRERRNDERDDRQAKDITNQVDIQKDIYTTIEKMEDIMGKTVIIAQ